MKRETKKKTTRQLHTRLPDDVFAFYGKEASKNGFEETTPYIRAFLIKHARAQMEQNELNINIQKTNGGTILCTDSE